MQLFHLGDGSLRILLLEDEPEMAAVLSAALQARDAVVDHVSLLADAEEAAINLPYDVILLDRQVPDGDGLSIVPKLRAAGVNTPVIVLTARGDLDDRIGGLDTGADDYLVKPFAMEELLARLRAILRRPGEVRAEVMNFGRLSYDFGCHDILIEGERLELPRREVLVFEALARRLGARCRVTRSKRPSTGSARIFSRIRWMRISPVFAASSSPWRLVWKFIPFAASAI